EETQNLLIPRLESLNFSFEGMDRFKPWYVGLKIREKVLKNRGYLPENGMDYYFLEKAGEKKRVRELERVKEKVAFLNSLSMSEQEAYLLATFWELELRKKSSAEIFAAWSWGDEESMDAIFSRAAREQGNGGDFYREVLHRRNQRFAEKIEGFLEGEGSYFVVVDASHLAGEKGIVNLLVEKGFTAQQL
ncbi:MAG TPA: TraB/GumN family protein, partial [Nitrospiria bacterium]